MIYYAGPCPAKPAISSILRPTQAAVWMFIPPAAGQGAEGNDWEGAALSEVIDAMVNMVPFIWLQPVAPALIASCIKHVEVVAFEDLGTRQFTGYK